MAVRRPQLELLETDIDDAALPVTPSELGISIDLTREDLEETSGDDLGFRSLYEHPEPVLRRWSHAA
jgi:hypothetical protein